MNDFIWLYKRSEIMTHNLVHNNMCNLQYQNAVLEAF